MGGKRTLDESTVTGMHDRMEINPRYRRAALYGMWFAAAFGAFFTTLAAFSWAGRIGEPGDAPMLLGMAVGGLVPGYHPRICGLMQRA